MAERGVTHRKHGTHEDMGAPRAPVVMGALRAPGEMRQPDAQTNQELMSAPSNTIQDTQSDFVFQHPFTANISGPTGKELIDLLYEDVSNTK